MFGTVSGGHFNPAVTLAAATIRRISIIDAVIYILAQLSGAVLGALLTKGLLLDEGRATHYGAVQVSSLLNGSFAGSVVEIRTFSKYSKRLRESGSVACSIHIQLSDGEKH